MRDFVHSGEERRHDLFREKDDLRCNAISGRPKGRASDQVAVLVERRSLTMKVDHHCNVIGSTSFVVEGTDIERLGNGIFVVR